MKTNFKLKENILTVCLGSNKEEKQAALQHWDTHVNIDNIEYDSMRLAPFFHYQIMKNGLKSVHEKRLKVLYKFWWLKTKHLSDQLEICCGILKKNNIDPIVLKGGSIMYYYPDPVLRPMSDMDILIPYNNVEDALSLLKTIGYTWKNRELKFIRKFPKATFDFYHAIGLKHEKLGIELDLHWRVGSILSYEFTEKLFNNVFEHPGISSAFRPKLAYDICLTILHGVISKNRDNLNWIIDILIVGQLADNDIWKEVYKLALNEGKLYLLKDGISYLNALGLTIPLENELDISKKNKLITQNKEFTEISNPLKVFKHRFNNSRIIVRELFPKAGFFKRCIHFFRLLSMQVLRYFLLHKKIFQRS